MESVRGLTGAGPSQVGPVGAMRARDVSRPRAEHVAAAEAAEEADSPTKRRRPSRRRDRAAQAGDDAGQAGDGSSPVPS
jgi:hypothetical protein